MAESSEQYPGWTMMRCGACDGTGLRETYGDGPAECRYCNNGIYYLSPNGRMAEWPGGPFLGSLPAKERASLAPSSAVTA